MSTAPRTGYVAPLARAHSRVTFTRRLADALPVAAPLAFIAFFLLLPPLVARFAVSAEELRLPVAGVIWGGLIHVIVPVAHFTRSLEHRLRFGGHIS